jgi:hypothetical protein
MFLELLGEFFPYVVSFDLLLCPWNPEPDAAAKEDH